MNDLNCFFKDVLTEARKRLSEGNMPDDDKALDIIIDAVFSDERSRLFSHDDLDRGIRTVFLKTRKRLGILHPLIEDNTVTEIMVNGPDRIFVEKNGEIKRYALSFDSEEEIEEIMRNIAGDVHREISEFVRDAEQFDDLTMLCLEYKGSKKDDKKEGIACGL